MTVNQDYEISSEGAVRHWRVPYARLEHATPDITEACMMLSVLPGTQVGGTVLSLLAALSIAIVDMTCGMVYEHAVRNVLTYNGGNEATWGAINIGDPIYYDRSATMPANVFLSTSPLDNTGAANARFGVAVDSGRITYPLGGVTASTQYVAVMQRGAGA